MTFGLYIHIPYCLQKCHYCDFTTFSLEHRLKMDSYVELLLSELRQRARDIPAKTISSIYFGGGTPSLLPTKDILTLLSELDNLGFEKLPGLEVSIEINPGTIDQQRLDQYLQAGINRFSVGVQTFRNDLLQLSGREHDVKASESTLNLLSSNRVNYTMDLLFGLPGQSIADVRQDVETSLQFSPPHVSAYCLTIPEGHFMNKGRATDSAQAEMFDLIEDSLAAAGILRYEISNYAKPGFESQHNLTYWNDQPYWGIGVSAHSYFPDLGRGYGLRFWNSTSSKQYETSIHDQNLQTKFFESFPAEQKECLELHEAMTDYCHTQLRKMQGLSLQKAREKFGAKGVEAIASRAATSGPAGLTEIAEDGFLRLTNKGRKLANLSFLEFTFSAEELRS